jgi:rhomboid protease GluP
MVPWVESQSSEHGRGDVGETVTVFRGSRPDCAEFSLVLDSRSVPHERVDAGGEWLLQVPPSAAAAATEELDRYRVERSVKRERPAEMVPFAGSQVGAALYAAVLILVAYCAGVAAFGRDWLVAGAIVSQPGDSLQWWRAFTALSLHLDQEHLLGNLLFGTGIGLLAGRMFGPGVAWLGIVLAGAAANYADMLMSPDGHRAVGASTAVFAALGMLAGYGWGQRLQLRERRLYRWAPLFAGSCLLALLGAGNEHVDVLGHLLGFLSGIVVGWAFARGGVPRGRSLRAQLAAGAVALGVMATAWGFALR